MRAVSPRRTARRRGAASVEYIALAGVIGLLIVIAIAALVASPPKRADRELGEMLARRIACTPRYPVPCGRNPLALAYGFPLGKLVRSLAPAPGGQGRRAAGRLPLLPAAELRRSRAAMPGLTSSRRRVTEFTSVEDLRRRRRRGPRHLLALPAGSAAGSGSCAAPGAAEIAAASSLRLEPRGRSGAGPARDPPRPGPLPASRRARSRPGAGRSPHDRAIAPLSTVPGPLLRDGSIDAALAPYSGNLLPGRFCQPAVMMFRPAFA